MKQKRVQIRKDIKEIKDVIITPTKDEVSLVETEQLRYELNKLEKEVLGKVQIVVVKGRDLMAKDDLTKTSDPYVVRCLNNKEN